MGPEVDDLGGEVRRPPSLRGFWMLFVVQLQGAFSDNFFKFLVIFFASRGVEDTVRDGRLFLILAIFTLPFILFAMASGSLSDPLLEGAGDHLDEDTGVGDHGAGHVRPGGARASRSCWW